jgi:signal transduction histidine kinase
MGALMRSIDWSQTPIGAMETWSPALRMMVSFLLANRFPLLLWWGPHYIQIYNDAYRPIPGTKHPHSMEQPASRCWQEIWDVIGPLIDTPFQGGPSTWMEDIYLEINRYGFVEESHFTIAYSPVPDDTAPRGIGGVLATVHEITEKVIGERRLAALRDLGAPLTTARTAEEFCAIAADTFSKHARDVPFALLYLIDPDGKGAKLAGAAGIAAGEVISPSVVDLNVGALDSTAWPLAEAAQRAAPAGPWTDPPHTAVVMPIKSTVPHQLAGLLVLGVSSRLKLSDLYCSFFELVTSQIATGNANARAYEAERKRAEALTEIDRAKTLFFSNVSHEFRTPLTLMLGPIEDMLSKSHTDLTPASKAQLQIVHRNSLRLLRLVNTMLDFSRIEAGRARANYQPTDLASFTAELASSFRSACERAGLCLRVDCPSLPSGQSVLVDRDMWEKIVLNLISNAFKFTLEGEIEVRLEAADGKARHTIRDTGVGIPTAELPRMFERFHRVPQTLGRTLEGTGIGLALVHELVKLHGGEVRVDSVLYEGSCFTITIPFGSSHLDPNHISADTGLSSTATGAAAFIECDALAARL